MAESKTWSVLWPLPPPVPPSTAAVHRSDLSLLSRMRDGGAADGQELCFLMGEVPRSASRACKRPIFQQAFLKMCELSHATLGGVLSSDQHLESHLPPWMQFRHSGCKRQRLYARIATRTAKKIEHNRNKENAWIGLWGQCCGVGGCTWTEDRGLTQGTAVGKVGFLLFYKKKMSHLSLALSKHHNSNSSHSWVLTKISVKICIGQSKPSLW